MATGSILLPIGAAILPDGSTDNAQPRIQRVKSSAAAPTPYFMQATFNDTTRQQCMWAFRMPAAFVATPSLKVQYKMASATSGAVVIEARVAAVTDGDAQDVDAIAFDSANVSSAITVPATAGYLDEISVGLDNNASLAAGDFVIVYLARHASAAGDTATGDMEVVGVTFEYVTA